MGRAMRPAPSSLYGLRRAERERQRLAVRARAERVVRVDALAEAERERVVGDRPAPGQQVQRRGRRADVVVRGAGVGGVAGAGLQRLRQEERAVDQMAGVRASSGRPRSAARRPRSRSRWPSSTPRTSARRPGVNGANVAAGPSVSDSVAGTEPPAVRVGAGQRDRQRLVAGDREVVGEADGVAVGDLEVAGHVRDADLEVAVGVGRAEVAHAVTAVAGHHRALDRSARSRW